MTSAGTFCFRNGVVEKKCTRVDLSGPQGGLKTRRFYSFLFADGASINAEREGVGRIASIRQLISFVRCFVFRAIVIVVTNKPYRTTTIAKFLIARLVHAHQPPVNRISPSVVTGPSRLLPRGEFFRSKTERRRRRVTFVKKKNKPVQFSWPVSLLDARNSSETIRIRYFRGFDRSEFIYFGRFYVIVALNR